MNGSPDPARLIFGCVALSTLPRPRDVFRLLDTAVTAGLRHFDTARIYGQGYSERLVGEFLRSHGDDIRVTTKLGWPKSGFASLPTWLALPLNRFKQIAQRNQRPAQEPAAAIVPPVALISRDAVAQSIAESLKCLGRSRLDVVLLHEALPSQLQDDARCLLQELQAAGIIGQLGLGTRREVLERFYTDDPLIEILQYRGSLEAPPLATHLFPKATHYHHGLLRQAGQLPPAETLALALAQNPQGRVIFSTRSPARILANLGLPV
jgi:D-threo-aldose 1-dehydrogenase